MSGIYKSKTNKKLLSIGQKVQSWVDQENRNFGNEIPEESSFAQAGMQDGLAIIEEFVSNDENGLAYEHILYMIEENSLVMGKDLSEHLRQLRDELKM